MIPDWVPNMSELEPGERLSWQVWRMRHDGQPILADAVMQAYIAHRMLVLDEDEQLATANAEVAVRSHESRYQDWAKEIAS
jgi:hypothetical protein